ncbi:haloacid dehalogenase superfamily, subfamily IA, variant 3 with third motif having DD or ED [Actinobaculum suis]|uniref:HAD family phosphatase n=1 Tax=Actinobaculum suis TaxID=1657 RepID=A0A1G7B7R7_9ACTO|nr:HAD family phosphatase [Actinobaculum suis]MDY5153632.1 HAD family phosphatase [Actinobaculum suis]SDE23129.1 haloacid dehalogenase superfamily, subfamily IA, variant 3 with third motif having DD or ED [Actinobaculum suis]
MSLHAVLTGLGLADIPAAVLWDMDGTIIDTEDALSECSREIVIAHGGTWTAADGAYVLGASVADHAARLQEAVARGPQKTADGSALLDEVEELLGERAYSRCQLVTGAAELLRAFRTAAIPQALVTATSGHLVTLALESLSEKYFDTVVTGSDPVAAKPDPAPYLEAARRLGVNISECLIFEDSFQGLAAARASGSHVVDVVATPLTRLAPLLHV